MTAEPEEPGGPSNRPGPSIRSAVVAGLVTVLVAALLANLGLWQLRRHAEVVEVNDALEARLAAAAVDLGAVVADLDPERDRFLVVDAVGSWRHDESVLWRNRARNRVNGSILLTPFELEAGGKVLVARGWLPPGADVADAALAPPPGTVVVSGLLRRSVDQPGFGAQDPPHDPATRLEAFFHVDVPRIDQQVDGDLAPMWLQATGGATGWDEVLRDLDPVRPDAGPHLGYAMQWFGFALTAVVAYGAWLHSRVLRPHRRSPARAS